MLVVCQHFWPESFRINDICDFLGNKGCDIEVLCGLPNYPSGKFPEGYGYFKNRRQVRGGVRIRRAFEIPRGSNTNFRIFLNYISFPFSSLFHIPRLLTKNFDKIFIYQLSPVIMSVAGIIVGKLKKTETTMYVLDLWPENLYSVLNIRSPFLRSIARSVSHWHYRHVDKLVVLSEKMKAQMLEITGKSADNIIVLPQACEKIYEAEDHDDNLRKRFSKGFNIVYTGNISPAQSFETVIEAAVFLKNEGLHDINWIIVGDGMSRKWLEAEVTKAGLQDIFYFEGQKPVEDIPKYTDIADVLLGCLVKSNLLEATIPAKVMSYLASGKPMVLAMDGEVHDLINNTIRCGYAGPTEDTSQLARNILKVYSLSTAERKQMGKRGKDYHFKHFERSLLLNKLHDFIFK
ncbi:glycosyltransferase WbuB [Candidatus Saccharibacteria bacterium]|nr:MAG: glycosyltransferase WbuB [Candidatus Saccharibacteria bacterium]